MDLVGKAPAPKIGISKITAPKIDPIKAASEFRHIATFKPGRFDRNDAGTPILQGEPLDAAKAELMEHALKARDANDLDAFEAGRSGKIGEQCVQGPGHAVQIVRFGQAVATVLDQLDLDIVGGQLFLYPKRRLPRHILVEQAMDKAHRNVQFDGVIE